MDYKRIEEKNKKNFIIAILSIVIVFLLISIIILLVKNFNDKKEITWVKNERGVYIKEREEIISKAINLYLEKRKEQNNLSGQCLGNVGDYAVSVENQCPEYKQGQIKHFIELDNSGRVIRII